MLTYIRELDTCRFLTIAIGLGQNGRVDFYSMERLIADRQAELRRDMLTVAAVRRPGRLGIAVAGALRGLADRLDGGHPAASERLGSLRVVD